MAKMSTGQMSSPSLPPMCGHHKFHVYLLPCSPVECTEMGFPVPFWWTSFQNMETSAYLVCTFFLFHVYDKQTLRFYCAAMYLPIETVLFH